MSAPIDHKKIEEQAKHIMDSFLKELGDIKQEDHFGLQRENEIREPRQEPTDETFRRAFLANAPNVKDNQLIMERKNW